MRKAVALLLVLLAPPVFAQETSDPSNTLWACGPSAGKFDVDGPPQTWCRCRCLQWAWRLR
jgi:hypothetical protein